MLPVSNQEELNRALEQGYEFCITEYFDVSDGTGVLELSRDVMENAHPYAFANLCNALAATVNVHIHYLSFSDINLGPGDVSTLTMALERAKVLKIRILDLSANGAIGKRGISAIACLLSNKNQKIEDLDLSNLYMRDQYMPGIALIPIFEAIVSTDHPLKTLAIGGIGFDVDDESRKSETSLLSAIKNTKAPLTQVNLRRTGISKGVKQEIRMILAHRRRDLYGGPPVEPEDLW